MIGLAGLVYGRRQGRWAPWPTARRFEKAACPESADGAAQMGKIGTMNRLNRKGILGFTIIELMIVLVIVAILLGLAYPSYIQYVRKSKRGEAQQLLMNWSVNQEIWRSNNPQYADTDDLPEPTNDNYTFDIDDRTATTYTLIADASGDQENDVAKDGTSCDVLTLDQNGVKSEAVCWE
jgi:type IV pilus assembly protein PilE